MDKIILRNLCANAIIGTLPAERIRRQRLKAEITIETDLSSAGKMDDLTLSIDYSEIERKTLHIMENSSFFLIEALCTKIGSMLLEYPAVKRATVAIAKPGALKHAGVEIIMNFEQEKQQ